MVTGYVVLALFLGYSAALAVAVAWNAWSSLSQRRRHRRTSSEPDTADVDAEVVVTLVHGTWARHASWLQVDSALRGAISLGLAGHAHRFVAFHWSGRNTISSRHSAGKALAETLAANASRSPRPAECIFAHSHCGSVALLALANERARQAVAGVVCISTPFLVGRVRSLGLFGSIGLTLTPALLAVLALGQTVKLLPPVVEASPAFRVPFVVGVIVVGFLVASRTPGIAVRYARDLMAKLETPVLPPNRVLIVRAPADEASAALGAAQILSFVTSKLWNGTGRILEAAVARVDEWGRGLAALGWRLHVLSAVLLLGIVVAAMVPARSGSSWKTSVLTTASCLVVLLWSVRWREGWGKFIGALLLGVVAAPLPVLLAILSFPFGPELALACVVLEVTAEATPPGRWTVWQLPPDSDESASPAPAPFMHSLAYRHPRALAEIATWIRERIIARPGALPGSPSGTPGSLG